VGQQEVIENVTDAVQFWWDERMMGRSRPLVLVFTGSTGVGKTESAKAVARGLLTGSTSTLDGFGKTPLGFLEFRGEHFQDSVNVAKLREVLREELALALYKCAGNVVVLFDEVQKAYKPALTELMALMQGQNSQLLGLDASRLVLIITSDSGLSVIDKLSDNATEKSLHYFLERLRRKLNDEFEEFGVPLGNLADHIIPFQNLDQATVRKLITHYTNRPRLPPSIVGVLDRLDLDREALTFLSSKAYVPYTRWRWDNKSYAPDSERSRLEVEGGCFRVQRPIEASLDPATGGSTITEGAMEHPFSVCGVPCTIHSSCSSNGGARPVWKNSEGPVKRLLKLLSSGKAWESLKSHDTPTILREKERETDPSTDIEVVVRVGVTCSLPSSGKIFELCTPEGLKGVGLSVKRCVVKTNSGKTSETCSIAYEGPLPA